NERLIAAIEDEQEGRRNLALYLRDPHVVVATAPQNLFLDPSHTYRLSLAEYRPGRVLPAGFRIRQACKRADADEIPRLLSTCRMVTPASKFIWRHRTSKALTWFVAEDPVTSRALGTVM